MAKNKQDPVPLSQAWQKYWDLLFQDDGDWISSLERMILRRVVLLEFGEPAIGSVSPLQILPKWTDNLQIALRDQSVSMSIEDLGSLNCHLIFDSMTEEAHHWKTQHPIKELVTLDVESRRRRKLWLGDGQKILNRATIGVGRAIRRAVHAAIQDGKFVVHGRPSDAPFDEPKTVPQSAFAGLFELHFFDNTITFGVRDSKISTVSLSPVVDYTADQPRSNSFEEADLILVEEMKQRIDSRQVLSILAAAKQVLPKAKRQNNASDESVIDRLRRRFQRHHPNYMQKISNKID